LQPKECTICLDELEPDFFHELNCKHSFCRDCLKDHLTTKINDRETPINCPNGAFRSLDFFVLLVLLILLLRVILVLLLLLLLPPLPPPPLLLYLLHLFTV
jgi:hypothetical protein